MIALTAKQQRRRANERSAKRQRNKQAKVSGRKPERDPEYLNFIRSLGCVICDDAIERRVFIDGIPCRQESPTEAAHTGPHALGRKSSDRTTIPLCGHKHHREGPESYHKLGPKKFEKAHGINIAKVVFGLNKFYDSKHLAYQEAE